MENRRPHQFDQPPKDALASWLHCRHDGLNGGVGPRAPLRPELVGELAVDRTGPKRLLRFVVGRRTSRIVKENEERVSMFDHEATAL